VKKDMEEEEGKEESREERAGGKEGERRTIKKEDRGRKPARKSSVDKGRHDHAHRTAGFRTVIPGRDAGGVRDLQPFKWQGDRGEDHRDGKQRKKKGSCQEALERAEKSEVPPGNFLNTMQKGKISKGAWARTSSTSARRRRKGTGERTVMVNVSEGTGSHHHTGEGGRGRQGWVTVEVSTCDMDREGLVSLTSRGDPWNQFARTHQIGQVSARPGHQSCAVRLVRSGGEEGIERLGTSPSCRPARGNPREGGACRRQRSSSRSIDN